MSGLAGEVVRQSKGIEAEDKLWHKLRRRGRWVFENLRRWGLLLCQPEEPRFIPDPIWCVTRLAESIKRPSGLHHSDFCSALALFAERGQASTSTLFRPHHSAFMTQKNAEHSIPKSNKRWQEAHSFFFLSPPLTATDSPWWTQSLGGLNALAVGQCKRNLIQAGDKGRLKSQMNLGLFYFVHIRWM